MIFFLIISLFSIFCQAKELSVSTQKEIDYLFMRLESSNCQFNRNGSWYTAIEASGHLRKKYEYLIGKNLLTTTESFIKRAATESSISGKLYQVKCDNKPIVPSSIWFNDELTSYRTKK